MTLKVVPIIAILFFCTSCGFSLANIFLSKDEDLELERQLKILNKPPVKTIKTAEGDIMDCIDINKQPALDHPLLKNHKVQTRPTTFPTGLQLPETSSTSKTFDIRQNREPCPAGTVPIRRTSKEDLIRVRSLQNESMATIHPETDFPNRSHVHVVNLGMKKGVPYFGAEAYIASWGLNVAGDQHSSTNIWVQNGPPDQLNVILAGWTADNAWITGCYNQLCSGFITIDTVITPGLIVSPISFWGGSQYDTKYLIYQDRPTGNWWFVITNNNTFVGYWPKELFNHLSDGAETVAWGGIAIAGNNGISPPMGSGYTPDGNFRIGCYFRNIHFVNDQNKYQNPRIDATEEFVDKSGCYVLLNQRNCGHDQMYYCFTFGGPGGKCGD
ncbi:hypothetical protein Pint_03429 [Pistacia integerrima]|uniref:Uncharacterized protein n=1 Tax=Pistacia integerrima TaxID=434235 RepID=A0ACC0ZRJ2_9ROSI|nr:hypothetical protein Pint_03429 [Pistacia integerrima]